MARFVNINININTSAFHISLGNVQARLEAEGLRRKRPGIFHIRNKVPGPWEFHIKDKVPGPWVLRIFHIKDKVLGPWEFHIKNLTNRVPGKYYSPITE